MVFIEPMHRNKPNITYLLTWCAPCYVKKKKMGNFMWLLEFECAKRLQVQSQAIPDQSWFLQVYQ